MRRFGRSASGAVEAENRPVVILAAHWLKRRWLTARDSLGPSYMRGLANQQSETRLGGTLLNRLLHLGEPESYSVDNDA